MLQQPAGCSNGFCDRSSSCSRVSAHSSLGRTLMLQLTCAQCAYHLTGGSGSDAAEGKIATISSLPLLLCHISCRLVLHHATDHCAAPWLKAQAHQVQADQVRQRSGGGAHVLQQAVADLMQVVERQVAQAAQLGQVRAEERDSLPRAGCFCPWVCGFLDEM